MDFVRFTIEEITVKTIEGNQSSWKVSVGPQGKEKTIDSKRLDGELYGSIEEVQGVLRERLDRYKMCDCAGCPPDFESIWEKPKWRSSSQGSEGQSTIKELPESFQCGSQRR